MIYPSDSERLCSSVNLSTDRRKREENGRRHRRRRRLGARVAHRVRYAAAAGPISLPLLLQAELSQPSPPPPAATFMSQHFNLLAEEAPADLLNSGRQELGWMVVSASPALRRTRTAAARRRRRWRRWAVTSRHVLQIQLSFGTTWSARLVRHRQPPWITQVQIVAAPRLLLTAMFLLLLLPRMALLSAPLQLARLLRWPRRRGHLAKLGGRRPSRFCAATPQSLSPSVSSSSPTSCGSGLNSVSMARR